MRTVRSSSPRITTSPRVGRVLPASSPSSALIRHSKHCDHMLGTNKLIPKISIKKATDFSQLLDSKVSRYEEDFEELEKLGRGAFGKVKRARNRIDVLQPNNSGTILRCEDSHHFSMQRR
jgi:hypothetical protein